MMWHKIIPILMLSIITNEVSSLRAHESPSERFQNIGIDSTGEPENNMEKLECLTIVTFAVNEQDEYNRWDFQLVVPLMKLRERNMFKMQFDNEVLWILVNGTASTHGGKFFYIEYNETLFGQEGLALIPVTLHFDKENPVPRILDFKINDKQYCIIGNYQSASSSDLHKASSVQREQIQTPSPVLSVPFSEVPPPCLQLTDMIDQKGRWNATLQIPAASLKSGMDISLEFDKELYNFQSNFGQFSTKDGKLYQLNDYNPTRNGDNPVEMQMNLFFNASENLPNFKNVLINGKIFCLQHATLNMFTPSFTSFVANNNGPCLKFFEEIKNGVWNATFIPPEDTKSFKEIRMVFDRELVSMTTDHGKVTTNDQRKFFVRFEGQSPPEVKFFFEYYRNAEIPQLRTLVMDNMRRCVHLMTMASSTSFDSYGSNMPLNTTRMTKATTKMPKTTMTSRMTRKTTKTSVVPLNVQASTTEMPTRKPVITPTSAYFETVSEKYKPASAMSNKNNYYEQNKMPFITQDSNGENSIQKLVHTDVKEIPEKGYIVNNVYLNFHFPSTGKGFLDFLRGMSPEIPDNKLDKPGVDTIKNLGKQNTFYNYFGDSQYVTYTSPHSIGGSEQLLDIRTGVVDTKKIKSKKMIESTQENDFAFARGSLKNADCDSNKKTSEFVLPRMALFVRNTN